MKDAVLGTHFKFSINDITPLLSDIRCERSDCEVGGRLFFSRCPYKVLHFRVCLCGCCRRRYGCCLVWSLVLEKGSYQVHLLFLHFHELLMMFLFVVAMLLLVLVHLFIHFLD